MGLTLWDEMTATPPKLSLSALPSYYKPPLDPPGALTPPLHPMVSVPFEWEQAPGQPKSTMSSSPLTRPKSSAVRCLDLPPRMLAEGKTVNLSPSQTTVLDAGPNHLGRSLSQRLCFVAPGPKSVMVTPDLGLVKDGDVNYGSGLGQVMRGRNEQPHFGSCRWASGRATKWDPVVSKGTFDFSLWGGRSCEGVDIEVKITRFRRSRKSLYKLSYKGSRVLGSIYESLRQMVGRRQTNKRN